MAQTRKVKRDRYPLGECVRWGVHGERYVNALPFYKEAPKNYDEQLDYRLRVREQAATNPKLQRQLLAMCRDDVLFWINTFVYIAEPRESLVLPFNTWEHQDCVIASMCQFLGKRDMKGDKSRAQGASWIGVALFAHRFLFYPNSHLACVSRSMELADDPKNPDSLGWKFDFLFSMLPKWMKPGGLEVGAGQNRNQNQHTWINPLNGSTIKCYAADQDVARGGRRLAFLFDEMAFFPNGADREAWENLRSVTNCRIAISTPNGQSCLFHDLIYPEKPDRALQFVLDWEDNPEQNVGLYTSHNGKLEILDKGFDYPADYEFVLDGIKRSPWFDDECERAGWNMIYINRELRRNHEGSKARPFSEAVLARASTGVAPPRYVGDFEFEVGDLADVSYMHFTENPRGNLKLWIDPLASGLPPKGRYIFGCDIAAGLGGSTSSNSVIQVFNETGEQVAEFASHRIEPAPFAHLAVALCYWFGRGEATPYLVWERNGPTGMGFTREVEELGYTNIYTSKGYKGRISGYHNPKRAVPLSYLISSMTTSAITVRSAELVTECGQYEFDNGNDYVLPKSKSAQDSSSQGQSHGDRAMAASMAIIGMRKLDLLKARKARKKRIEPTLANAPPNSIAGRMFRAQQNERIAMYARSRW